MWHDVKTFMVGSGGYIATVQLGDLAPSNGLTHFLASLVAVCTVAALIPLAVERWKKFLGENTLSRTGRILFFILATLVVLVWASFVSGCGVQFPKLATPHFTAPGITQTGAAATPGEVSTQQTTTTIPNLPGTTITISTGGNPSPSAAIPGTSPAPPVVISSSATSVRTPTAYAPPAGPTARDQANADAVTRSYYFAGALVIAAAFLFWRAHIKAAIVAAVAAIACPLLTNFVSSVWGQRVFLIGACIALSLFAAWHFQRDKSQPSSP